MTLELVHNKAEASGKHFCFSKPLLLHRYGSRQCLQVTPSSLKYSISKITSLLHRNKSETALNVKTLCVSSPKFSHNSDLKQPQDKLMFQKPLNNSLARASNKHCSLHRIHQVDMKDKLAGWYQMFPIPCSHRAVKAVWSVGITLSFSWCDCELTDRPLWPRWERPWSSDQPHRGKWRIFPSGVEANRRKRKRECPTRTPRPSLITIQMWVRSKEKLWPGPHHRNRVHYLAPCESFSSQAWTVKLNSHESPWTVLMTNWTIPLSSAYCWWSQPLLSNSWVYFGPWGDVFSWVIFCIKAFKYAYIITVGYLTSYTCATAAGGSELMAILIVLWLVWFLNSVGLLRIEYKRFDEAVKSNLFRRELRMIHNNSIS